MKKFTNEFSWSFSRANVFDECKRRYWFNYYGYWGGWEDGAPARTRKIYNLKNLKSRWMWGGEVVHRWVKDVLGAARIGTILAPERVIEKAKEEMRTEFKESRIAVPDLRLMFNGESPRGSGENRRERGKKKTIFFEHLYDPSLPDGKWAEIADGVEQCLKNFFSSKIFADLAAVPEKAWIHIEEENVFPSFLLDGEKVFAKADCAHRLEDSSLRIIDWKTERSRKLESSGFSGDGSDRASMQMGCYALFAVDKWEGSAGKIRVLVQNLFNMDGKEQVVSQDMLDRTRSVIRGSIRSMRSYLKDSGGNTAEEEEFPYTENKRSCNFCNFKMICEGGPVSGRNE